jgi:hypothetical protein
VIGTNLQQYKKKIMKKLILTALLIGLIYSYGICQGPTLYNYNIVPKIGDIQISYIADTNGITFNNTGANFVWDYSNLNVTANKVYSFFEDPETTPYISSFNSATLVGTATDYYSYYYADTNEFSRLGNGSSSYVMIDTDPLKTFEFPFNFGDQMTDSMYATYILSSKMHQYSGFNSLVADGWGKLKLPKNSYTNVLRLKRMQYFKDTASGENTETFITMYSWYNGINNFPLLQAVFNKRYTYGNPTPTINNYIYVSDLTQIVSIPSLKNSSQVNIYPNPAHNELNIEFKTNQRVNFDITLTDLLGNIVRQIDTEVLEIGKYQNTIEISGLPKGLYTVKIITGPKVQVKSIIIQ